MGGGSKDRANEHDKCKIDISLSLSSNSTVPIESILSKPSSPESPDNPNRHVDENSLEIPVAAGSTFTSISSSSSTSSITVDEGSRKNWSSSGGSSNGEVPVISTHVGAASMVLAGCPRCLMYVMLWKENPRCPRCNNSTLLNIFNGH